MRLTYPIDIEKRERPAHVNVYRDIAFLTQCSEQDAQDCLKNRPVEFSTVFATPRTLRESHVLEYILYRRNAPLIDLALAQHGRSRSVLERVFRRGNLPTRVVACANPSLFVGNVLHESPLRVNLLWQIVRRGSLAELRVVCENPHLTSGFYTALVDCWEGLDESPFPQHERLSSNRFQHVLFFLSNNPRISVPREESQERYYYDGFSDYEYTKFFTDCWKLAQVVPVEPEWAYVLARLYQRLYRPYDVFDDIAKVLDRWRPAGENLEPSLHDELPSPFPDIREQIAAKFVEPSIESSKDSDPAIRRAFYGTFDPERPEFRELDWTEWSERDEWCYIWLSSNEKIWRSPLGRSNLRSMLWHQSRESNDLVHVGYFDKQEQEIRKANPEWFDSEEDSEEWENGESEADRIEHLERTVRNMAEATAKRRFTDAIWFLLAALTGALIGAAI